MKRTRPWPKAIITRKAAKAIGSGHLWVYASEVIRLEPSSQTGEIVANGGLVDVFEENGTWQGTGLISLESTIRIRLISRNANDRFDKPFWERRIRWAWELRQRVMDGRGLPSQEPDSNCCRIIFSEADGLPGLIVDRYEDVLVSQIGTVGMERLRHTLYPLIIKVLAESSQKVRGIFERCDSPVRAKEGLPERVGWYDFAANGDAGPAIPSSERVIAHENGVAYDLDVRNSQKTGFFLDQKYNRRAIRELAGGRHVLDCFCHVGPFGLNAAAGGAAWVRGVDVSKTAITLARENARLNGFSDRMAFTCADVLEYLPRLRQDRSLLREEGGPFDLIVLDPPAFTKSGRTVRHAAHGYRQINYEALRLLPHGGILATCSCSQHMTRDLLARAIAEAAHDANVQLRQLEELQQAPDHPILWGMPETHYLDFFIFQKV